MIGLSTSAFGNIPGEQIISRVHELGFSSIELNFTLLPKQADEIIKLAPKRGITISSLHNFVPEPPEGERGFMLSDIDQALRRRAVELAADTVRLAADTGARAVVLHMGQPRGWGFEDDQHRLRQLIHAGAPKGDIGELRQAMTQTRQDLPGAHLDSMLRSLDRLASLAGDMGITLGIENRYYYGQFPDHEELGILMQEFSGAPIGYWHDCGHARQIQYTGFGKEDENLEAFGDRLVGIHLHDTRLWDDHRIPKPDGDIDFAYLKPYITKETILVLELSRGRDFDAISAGMEHLRVAGIE